MQGILRFRAPILIVIALLTAAAIYTSQTVRFQSDLEIWFLDDDPELAVYHQFLETFHTDELLVVGVFADDVFAPHLLEGIDALTESIGALPKVHRVRSLTNGSRFEGRSDTLAVVPIVPNLPVTSSAAATIRRISLSDGLVAGTLVSEDGQASAIMVELSETARSFDDKVALVHAVMAMVAKHTPQGATVRLAGTPAINEAVLRYSQRDFQMLGSMAIVLMLLITFLVFRQIWTAVLPLMVVLLSVLWLFGLMGLLGLHINLVSQSLTVVIFAVGIADAIHVITDYQQQLVETSDPHEALVKALRIVFVPCFFTTVTTAAGMLSLSSSRLAPIREFGILAAIGVVFALILSFTFLPAALSYLKPPAHSAISRHNEGPIARLLHEIALLSRTRRRPILLGFGLIVAGSSYLVPQLDVGANPAAYFKPNDPVRRDMRQIDQALGGSTSIELLVTSTQDGLRDPEQIAKMDGLQRWLEDLPSVAKVASITDGLRAINLAMSGESRLPKNSAELAQSYLLIEDEPDFGALVTEDYEMARISARVRMSEAAALISQLPRIESKLRDEFSSPALTVKPTGFVKLISEMEIHIVDSQIKSFVIAFGLISLLMIVMLRSVKLGLFAMIPNLGPVVIGLAVMQQLHIRLDPGTAMLGSLTLGLVVDDTVHMVTRIKHHLGAGLAMEPALSASIIEVGRALSTTSLILAAGFSMLAFGSFTPNIYLGIMAAVIIGVALVTDLLVLPAALSRPLPR